MPFSQYKKTLPKRDGKKQEGKANMFTYRHCAFGKRIAESKPYAAVGAWFLGPKAENAKLFTDLATEAFDAHFQFRKRYYPCDPPYVTEEIEQTQAYQNAKGQMENELEKMRYDMYKSVPLFSTRYKGHVIWDTNLPADLGFVASILWNQNNAIDEAGPVTTLYELEAGSDLCEMVGFDRSNSMGHLVTGGSVANIEAMWAANNLKYYPLGIKQALLKEPRLHKALTYEVYIHKKGYAVPLVIATTWELFNLDTDTIVDMLSGVPKMACIEPDEYSKLVTKHLYEYLGANEFYTRCGLDKSPCIVAASTYHVSFQKAVTILGIGRGNLVTVGVDENARMKTDELRDILQEKCDKQIPVISVINIQGTTEESAVDPLDKILEIREDMKKKGLNFSIHADAAWGAYFASMLREPKDEFRRQNLKDEGFIPELSLNEHVTNQMKKLWKCDTITCDPHKSGFCPYPAGAICYRRKEINSFLNFTSDTHYYHGKYNLGNVGIEGSKPGAAASGVRLANKVIGLHKDGYGRILSQCMFTAKILYCYWLCLGDDEDDDFFVETTKPLPPDIDKNYIRQNIIGKTNEEIQQDYQLMSNLRELGPDTLIPCFSVNLRHNKDVKLANDLNQAIFDDLSHMAADETNKRVPLIVTLSTMVAEKHPLRQFKERLGLDPENTEGVKYIITTCLDPWSTTMDYMEDMAATMRNTVLNSIGTVQDQKTYHTFVSVDKVHERNEIFVCFVGNFQQRERQYFAVARLRFIHKHDADTFVEKASTTTAPIALRSCNEKTLHDLLYRDSGTLDEEFDFYEGLPSESLSGEPFMQCSKMKIVDVPRYDHFDRADDTYPTNASYILYGDGENAYLFHSPTKCPDYLQIVRLTACPAAGLGDPYEKDVILKQSVTAELLGVPGQPMFGPEGNILDPLKTTTPYELNFIGIEGQEVTTPVVVKRKIWFDGEVLNAESAVP